MPFILPHRYYTTNKKPRRLFSATSVSCFFLGCFAATPFVRSLLIFFVQQLHQDLVAVTGQRLVDGVVHDLIDEMVQAALAGGTDLHTGAFADRFQSLQHLYGIFVVIVGYGQVDVVVHRGLLFCTW